MLGIAQARVEEFAALCARERCPFAVVGTATSEERLVVGYGATITTVYGGTASEAMDGQAHDDNMGLRSD